MTIVETSEEFTCNVSFGIIPTSVLGNLENCIHVCSREHE